MQIISIGDNLHKMSNPVFWENNFLSCRILFSGKKEENISICLLLSALENGVLYMPLIPKTLFIR